LIFEVKAAQDFIIKAATGDTIEIGPDVSAAAGTLTSAIVGAMFEIVPSGDTSWKVINMVNKWKLE
jgi:hypothetical protein